LACGTEDTEQGAGAQVGDTVGYCVGFRDGRAVRNEHFLRLSQPLAWLWSLPVRARARAGELAHNSGQRTSRKSPCRT